MEIVIYKVSLALTENFFKYKIIHIKVNETDKCYVAFGLRLKKTKLLEVNSSFTGTKMIGYHTFCLEDNIETAKIMLFNAVAREIDGLEKDVITLKKSLNSVSIKNIPVIIRNDEN